MYQALIAQWKSVWLACEGTLDRSRPAPKIFFLWIQLDFAVQFSASSHNNQLASIPCFLYYLISRSIWFLFIFLSLDLQVLWMSKPTTLINIILELPFLIFWWPQRELGTSMTLWFISKIIYNINRGTKMMKTYIFRSICVSLCSSNVFIHRKLYVVTCLCCVLK